MRGKDLYYEIGEADEKYIKSAGKAYGAAESKEKIRNAGRMIKNVLSVAAAVVIIGGLWAVSYMIVANNKPGLHGPDETGNASSFETGAKNSAGTESGDLTFNCVITEKVRRTGSFSVTVHNSTGLSEAELDPAVNRNTDLFIKHVYSLLSFEYDLHFSLFPDEMVSEKFKKPAEKLGCGYEQAVRRSGEIAGKVFQTVVDEMEFDLNGVRRLSYDDINSDQNGMSRFRDTLTSVGIDLKDIKNVTQLSVSGVRVNLNGIFDFQFEDADLNPIIYDYHGSTYIHGIFEGDLSIDLLKDEAKQNGGSYDGEVQKTVTVKKASDHGFIDEAGEYYLSYDKISVKENERVSVTHYTAAGGNVYGIISYNVIAEGEGTATGTGSDDPDTSEAITTDAAGGGLFIGFIDVPGMAYTDALRLEEVGGYPFAYRDGQELTVRKNGTEIYGLKTAYNSHLIDDKELRDFFLEYIEENRPLYDEFMPEILSQSIEEFAAGYGVRTVLNRPASLGRITYYNYIDVIFTMYLGNRYAAVYKTADERISDFVEKVSVYEFSYKDGYMMRILDGEGVKALSELSLELKSGEISGLHREYTEFYYSYFKEARTGKELTEVFEEYFKTGKPATKNGYTVKYAVNIEGAYIGNVDKDGEPLAGNVRFEVVDGLPFSYPVYTQGFTVVRNNDYAIGLKTALDDRLINDEELELFFEEYANYTNFDGYDIIVKSLNEYLDGAKERNSKDGTEKKKLDCYRYINIYYCIKLSDDKYAALYSVLGEMRSDFAESAESITIEDQIFTFIYKNGIYLRIVDENGIFELTSHILTGSPDDLLTSSEVIKLHDSYKKYINGNPATIKEAFNAFIQTGEGYY
ncbi:MAG: hypothetical protein J5879_08915, partial [Clostridia bacterium]|nr:hypothetical protein [Clostridia bacterium]